MPLLTHENIDQILVFRFIHVENLEHDLTNGLFAKNFSKNHDPTRKLIANEEIIQRRDQAIVKCYPDTVVSDYVPFYFSVRTPMLYNIKTGWGVPKQKQEAIVYLVCQLSELATADFQWCFTNGNATSAITRFYNNLEYLPSIDWRSIKSEDFRDNNSDGDFDRKRKKHAEFLVKGHVPASLIKALFVYNETAKEHVDNLCKKINFVTKVIVDKKNRFYF